MDFVLCLPTISGSLFDLGCVHSFSKTPYFMWCRKTDNASHVAKLVFREVVRLHRLPRYIVPDKDVKFISYFWKTLRTLCGTTLKFSTAFHPLTDGQTKVFNHNLGSCSVRGKQGTLDLSFHLLEFTYNNAVNRSTGKSPFEVVHDSSPHTPGNLIPLPPNARMIHPTSTFTCILRFDATLL